jgi:hypothetical protein
VVLLPQSASQGLVEHENEHVKQWWVVTALSALVLAVLAFFIPVLPFGIVLASPGVMGILILICKPFKFYIEASAYAVSARYHPERLERYALLLYEHYDTNRSYEDCAQAIRDKM